MNLTLTFRMKIDDPASGTTRRFTKVVKGQAPHVPRIGESVLIPGAEPSKHLNARRVEEVIYPLDGTVILEFSLDGLYNNVEDQVKVLRSAGFNEI